MNHPPAVIEKAQRLEQLLQRVEQGEALAQVCAELEVEVTLEQVTTLQTKYENGGWSWEALIDGRYGHQQKVIPDMKEWMYERKRRDKSLTGGEMVEAVKKQFKVELSVGHTNRLLRQVSLSRPPGRPVKVKKEEEEEEEEVEAEEVENVGLFFLEAAKVEMGVVTAVEQSVAQSRAGYQEAHPTASLRLLSSRPETVWGKLDHLLYLPLLNLERPRDLYYYQGLGLKSLYGFTYKYMPVEQFLGQASQLKLGQPQANALGHCYAQAWYGSADEGLFIFTDWHVKPHWTKNYSHSGAVTMWGRVMPGTKQLVVNGPEGRLLIGWNYPIDNNFSGVLVDMEERLADILNRPITCNIVDSEAGGLPLAKRYAEAKRHYLSVLPRNLLYPLTEFKLKEEWQTVEDRPGHEVVAAEWAEAKKAADDPRDLVLMRPKGQTDPTRIYAGLLPTEFSLCQVPTYFRQRWLYQERRFGELIAGANLNVNYGYSYDEVPHRTRQRQWQEAQEKVETTQVKLAQHSQALTNLRPQLAQLRQTYHQQQAELLAELESRHQQLAQRQQHQQPIVRLQRGIDSRQRQLNTLTVRYQKKRGKLLNRLRDHRQQCRQLQSQLTEREAARDAIDTDTLARERHLEKDQIMLNLQLLLLNLHDWAKEHYFASEWQSLQLETATRLIYQKSGRVRWYEDRIEVELTAYRYLDQQQAMETTCDRFNAANLRWRDGRLLRIYVAQGP